MFEAMEAIELEHGGTLLRGYVAKPEGEGPFPTVLVMHSALGMNHKVIEPTAKKLAQLGYMAICTDMFGAHLEGASQAECGAALGELMIENPAKQRARTVAWFDQVAARSDVDAGRIAAIGFCYGGTTVLELARSGADLRAFISYHGGLATHVKASPGAFKGHVVAYCGGSDPFVPQEHVEALHQEMIDAGHRDYQITVYGAADHGFTDPDSAALNMEGVAFHKLSNDLSWGGTLILLEHVFER
ncbi:hypothetical protein BSL82_17340 [Tardibacter chloracetimidivorans]|uniref:Dienelactone hydrolase domain-containing protein n=1 Tax=Tardibacter chloracetimidivorans TaxID=1921510 RepID=A0A1L3ZYX2_9SPHN|nr:dienelactone hydrolase family protein [Tardibacter chloracetimidivorans]API60827.1 hypothetical protein BSL82_17340 [Tardibacter chloracetimidivorans]